MAAIFLVLELYLAWIYRHTYRSLLTARALTVSEAARDVLWST
jgi:hypothetical protein